MEKKENEPETRRISGGDPSIGNYIPKSKPLKLSGNMKEIPLNEDDRDFDINDSTIY